LTEITRRYYACAIALSKAMGLPLTEDFMRQHRESISCCFIESGRAGVRLPPAVHLPPLAQAHDQAPEASTPEDAALAQQDSPPADPAANGSASSVGATAPSPTTIPTDSGLPCGGLLIDGLKPPQLSMLIGKVATLAEAQGGRWTVLLEALQRERARRLAKRRQPPVEG
jgi:hypothetical protein